MSKHTNDRNAPENVVPFKKRSDGGKKERNRGDQNQLFAVLSRIDELEDALEIMDEAGVTTREQLAALIRQLESEVAALEGDTEDT